MTQRVGELGLNVDHMLIIDELRAERRGLRLSELIELFGGEARRCRLHLDELIESGLVERRESCSMSKFVLADTGRGE